MSEINVFNKQSHKLDQTVQSNTVSLTKASVVVVHINLDDIVEVKKDKNNAVLVIESGEEITLVNYFNYGNINTSNSLVLQDDQNKLIWAKFTDANGKVLENIEYGQIEEIGMLFEPSSGFSPWLWAAVPAVGAGVYLLADNEKGAESSSPDIVDPQVEAPKMNPINASDLIKGKAEPGSTVTITFPNGDKKNSIADSAGNWSIANPGLKQGDVVTAMATNKNGTVSGTAKQEVDAVAPTLKISVSDVNLPIGKDVEVTFTFSEAVKDFDLRSITVTGGTLAKLTSKDNKTWTAVFTQKGSSDPSIKVADDHYSDLAGNKGKGGILDQINGNWVLESASTQSSFLVSAPIALEAFLVEGQPALSTQQAVPDEYSLPIQIDDLLVAAGPTELWVEHDLMLLKQQNDSSMTLQRPSDPFALDMYHATTAITIALLPQHDLI